MNLLLVAIDYFNKWIAAEAFASINDKEAVQFVWKNIVCRFGIPQSIVTNNGPQFDRWGIHEFLQRVENKKPVLDPTVPTEQRLGRILDVESMQSFFFSCFD